MNSVEEVLVVGDSLRTRRAAVWVKTSKDKGLSTGLVTYSGMLGYRAIAL